MYILFSDINWSFFQACVMPGSLFRNPIFNNAAPKFSMPSTPKTTNQPTWRKLQELHSLSSSSRTADKAGKTLLPHWVAVVMYLRLHCLWIHCTWLWLCKVHYFLPSREWHSWRHFPPSTKCPQHYVITTNMALLPQRIRKGICFLYSRKFH